MKWSKYNCYYVKLNCFISKFGQMQLYYFSNLPIIAVFVLFLVKLLVSLAVSDAKISKIMEA